MFMRNNPLSQSMRVVRASGQQLNFLRSMPRTLGNRLIPARFRKFTPKKGDAAEDADKDLPEDVRERGGSRRRGRGRRVGMAKRVEFTQVHLIAQGTNQRTVVHVGSTIGTHKNEMILNAGTRQAVQLEFSQVDSSVHGVPTLLTVLSGPKDMTVTVDNAIAAPSAPIRDGSIVDVNGQIFNVALFSGGSLPALTRVDAAWMTNVGPKRSDNQDALGIYQHKRAYMFSLADGVGGAYAGDKVSEFAVKYLLNVFKRNIRYEKMSWYDVYNKAYAYVNAEVRNFVEVAPGPAGTTLTSVFIRNWTMYVAHVGDTRVYLVRGRSIKQLTTDHNKDTAIQTRNRAGYPVTVTRTILDKAIGKTDEIEPDVFTVAIQPNDRILLMTDGISGKLSDDEIFQIATSNSLSRVPEELIELANLRDNTDNASVIAVEVMSVAYERDVWYADTEDRIYVGGPTWVLRLRKPTELNTVYSLLTQWGCFLLVMLFFATSCFWSGYQIQQTFFGDREVPQWASFERPPAPTEPSLLTLFTNAVVEPPTATPNPTEPINLLDIVEGVVGGSGVDLPQVTATPTVEDATSTIIPDQTVTPSEPTVDEAINPAEPTVASSTPTPRIIPTTLPTRRPIGEPTSTVRPPER